MKRIMLVLGILAVLVLCAASHSNAQTYIGKQFGVYSVSHVKGDSVNGHAADTLRLARAKTTLVTVHCQGTSPDTITAMTGGVTGRFYLFQIPTNDSAVVFYKTAGNVAIASNVVLNDTNSTALFYYDGKQYRLVSSALNH